MYATQATCSFWTWMLHVTLVVVGALLIGNLALAVIFLHFTKHYVHKSRSGNAIDDSSNHGKNAVQSPS